MLARHLSLSGIPGLTSFRRTLAVYLLVAVLSVVPPRRGRADNIADTKVMYYHEDGDRISVFAPTAALERDFDSGLTVRIEGIYNAISGATPTGAPPPLTTITRSVPGPATSGATAPPNGGGRGDGGGDGQNDSPGSPLPGGHGLGHFSAFSAATPVAVAPLPVPGTGGGGTTSATTTTTTVPGTKVPTARFRDERVGLNLSLSQRLGSHTPSLQASYSKERDYLSLGSRLQDSIDFNKKTTTFTYGGAFTHDTVTPANGMPTGTKNAVDGIVGVNQVLTPTTVFTASLTAGRAKGFLTDPYRVVDLNGALVPEKRPDNRTKTAEYLALTQFVTPLDGSIELSFRRYNDSYGIDADTVGAAWFQKLGDRFILSPRVRYYNQNEADFYAVTFSGSPEFYSADYRLSALKTTAYGLKAIWTPNARFSFDLEYQRYEEKGTDGVTVQDAYPKANVVIAGVRLWL